MVGEIDGVLVGDFSFAEQIESFFFVEGPE